MTVLGSVPAFRISPLGSKGADVPFLIADMARSKPFDDRWSSGASWGYHGFPLQCGGWFDARGRVDRRGRAGWRPVIYPETVVVDHALEFKRTSCSTPASDSASTCCRRAYTSRPTSRGLSGFFDRSGS